MSDNLKIWDQLATTDKQFTKNFARGGGFKGTAINPTYVNKRLTELFGPCGKGWKFVEEESHFQPGAIIGEGATLDRAVIHIVKGHLEYQLDGEWYATGPQYGQTTFVGEYNNGGMFTDEEAPKKSITDCTAKCAAMLGAAADIYLGEFDGNKYVNTPESPAAVTTRKPRVTKPTLAAHTVPQPGEPIQAKTAVEWTGVIQSITNAKTLHVTFDGLRATQKFSVEEWAKIVDVVANKARELCEMKTPERPALVAAIKEERAKIEPPATPVA